MAKRLGKREREAKRALIASNLANRPELPSRVIRTHSGALALVSGLSQVSTHRDTLTGSTHTAGFREPQRKIVPERKPGVYIPRTPRSVLTDAERAAIASYDARKKNPVLS